MCAAFLISASYDKQIRFWDGASGRTVRCFSFQDSQVNALWLIPDTTYLVVAGFGVLRVYDIGASTNTNSNNNNNNNNNNNTGGGGVGGTQAPPLFSSYENSSAMNMTSLGSFPLRSLKSGDPLFAPITEGSSSSLFNATVDFGATQRPHGGEYSSATTMMMMEELLPVLYATSEDGHIRFFSVNAATKLKLLRDITTGAAITCSALSPDRQTLLTGSQIGRVSVWHLPTIIAVATQQLEGSAEMSFGHMPLQEITFDSDYTAIRSIAIEPLARWAVAATNAGKLHFLRFEGDSNKSLLNSKSGMQDKKASSTSAAAGATTAEQEEEEEEQDEEENERTTTAEAQGGMNSSIAAAGSCETTTGSAGVKHSIPDGSCLQPESVYRSALVSNEMGNSVLKGSVLGSPFIGHNRESPGVSAAGGALAGSLDPSSLQVTVSPSKSEAILRNETSMNSLSQMSPLRQQFYMKVFHSFQAHYKYILKVAISPNTDLLVTCCADYTVGRFLIPPELQQGDQLKLIQRDDVGPSSSHESDPAASTTMPIDSIPTEAAAAAAITSTSTAHDEKTQEVVNNTQALLHPVKSATTPQATASEKPASTTEVQPTTTATNASSDMAELQKTNTTVGVDAACTQTTTRPAEGAASVRPADAPDVSSLLFSVIPSVSMEGHTHSHHARVLQFRSLEPMRGHTRWVWDCVFSDCGRFLFTASSDQSLRMWTGLLADRVQSTCYVGHTKPVVCCILYYEKKRNQF